MQFKLHKNLHAGAEQFFALKKIFIAMQVCLMANKKIVLQLAQDFFISSYQNVIAIDILTIVV